MVYEYRCTKLIHSHVYLQETGANSVRTEVQETEPDESGSRFQGNGLENCVLLKKLNGQTLLCYVLSFKPWKEKEHLSFHNEKHGLLPHCERLRWLKYA